MSKLVTAYTWYDEDRERPPQKVEGTLHKIHVPVWDNTKYTIVNDEYPHGINVDPTTIEPVTNANPNQQRDEYGRFTTEGLTQKLKEIDAKKFGANLVHLGDLHEATGLPKDQFHDLVKQAQREGKISLISGEGRGGYSQRDLDSMLHVTYRSGDKERFLYASIKRPTGNAYCPTGVGGGHDNSCSPSQAKSEFHEILDSINSGQVNSELIREYIGRVGGMSGKEVMSLHKDLGFAGKPPSKKHAIDTIKQTLDNQYEMWLRLQTGASPAG